MTQSKITIPNYQKYNKNLTTNAIQIQNTLQITPQVFTTFLTLTTNVKQSNLSDYQIKKINEEYLKQQQTEQYKQYQKYIEEQRKYQEGNFFNLIK